MKSFLFALLLAATTPIVCFAQEKTAYKKAETFITEKDYFRARDFYQAHSAEMTPNEKLVLQAYISNAFNRPALSNTVIAAFFKSHGKMANDSLMLELLRLKQINHGRLFEYTEALRVSDEILTKYSKLLSKEEIADHKNTATIWRALSGSPKQKITITDNTVIRMKRDKAKLANIEVKANGISKNFIFDTGANLSTVTETTAKAFNMRIMEGVIEVGSITGAEVNSHIAVCPVFSMGNITIKNAVFLVMPDTALAFPSIQFQINGIIGFPVIESLKEIQLSRNDEFIVPKVQSVNSVQNMALDFLTPIINIDGEYFTFDTGATRSILYSKYLSKHEAEIIPKYTETDLKFGGAGGMVTKKGFNIIFNPIVNSKKLALTDVHLFRESLDKNTDHFYGNIGEDVIKQFDKMILNFSSMAISFE